MNNANMSILIWRKKTNKLIAERIFHIGLIAFGKNREPNSNYYLQQKIINYRHIFINSVLNVTKPYNEYIRSNQPLDIQ